jgi:hypothetical protein
VVQDFLCCLVCAGYSLADFQMFLRKSYKIPTVVLPEDETAKLRLGPDLWQWAEESAALSKPEEWLD